MYDTMMYRTLALTALFFATPFIGNAQMPSVILSEIAWMGTDADANNEWIELYNFGPEADVTGWTIYLNDAPFITLTGQLPGPHRVSLLERTDDETLPDVTAFLVYTGALPNDVGTLTLRDQSGATVDTASGGGEWAGIGGSNTVPKKTAQRTNSLTWVTAAPTPGAANAQVSDPVATTTTETTATVVRSGGGGGGPVKRSSSSASKENIPPKLALAIDGPKTAYVNQEVSFDAVPSGVGKTLENSLSYDWNLGDTYTGKGKSVSHVFSYPGEYIVVAEGSFAKQNAMARHEVKVLPVSFTLSKMPNGDVMVMNNASYEVDLGGFALRGQTQFVFPKYTFVKANGTLIVPSTRIGRAGALSLHDGQGVAVVSTGGDPHRPQPVLATRQQAQVVTEVPEEDSLMVGAESTVIRIGETDTTPRAGVLNRFFARIARIFGS